MNKKLVSRVLIFIFLFSFYGLDVQAVSNSSSHIIKNENSAVKAKILSNFHQHKGKKNYKADEVIVKYKETNSLESIESSINKYDLKLKSHLSKHINLVNFDNSKHSIDEIIVKLNKDPDIEYAEPDYKSKLFDTAENEPYFNRLWGLKNNTYEGMDINVLPAWNTTKGNLNLVVGVIDSGIDTNHEDLIDNIWTNLEEIPGNGIDDDNDGYIDDYKGWNFPGNTPNPYDDNSHGTHVSGTIAASNNGIGVVGIAPNVKIMPLKAADSEGSLYASDVVKAINYGINKGIKIFNCSFGSNYFSQAQYDAIKNSNALFICASGNGDEYGNGLNNDGVTKNYPASFGLDNIISVASIDSDGALSSFSNYGLNSVDIAAPGGSIYSTIPGGYGYGSGTSMAAPHVTGVAALVLSSNMNLSSLEVKNAILSSTHSLPLLENKVSTGTVVDALGALISVDPSLAVNVDNITLDSTDLNLILGTSKKLNAAISPSNATDKWLKWTSSNDNIAKVDNMGKITAVSPGNAVIYASSAAGNITASCNVNVEKPFIPTDVDDNGVTDIKDLALTASSYNSKLGDSKYSSLFDINRDNIIDLFDLVKVSKEIK